MKIELNKLYRGCSIEGDIVEIYTLSTTDNPDVFNIRTIFNDIERTRRADKNVIISAIKRYDEKYTKLGQILA